MHKKHVKIATGLYKQKGTDKELTLIYLGGPICSVSKELKNGKTQTRMRNIVGVCKYLLKNDFYST